MNRRTFLQTGTTAGLGARELVSKNTLTAGS